MKKEEFAAEIVDLIDQIKPEIKFLTISDQVYLDIIKDKYLKNYSKKIFLDYGTKTEFDKKSVHYICEFFNISLGELNSYIEGYELKDNDLISNLFPKTRYLVNLFILTRKYNVVILILVGLSEDTNILWKEIFKVNYRDKKLVVVDVISTVRSDKWFSMKTD